MKPTFAPAVVAMALLAAPLAARADGAQIPPKARALAERGRAFHEAGKYPQAIEAFTQAYVIAPSPALLFNLAQAYRLQGNCDDAVLMYQRYLATNPSPEGREIAEAQLQSMERCVHKIALHIPGDDVKPSPASQPAAATTTTTTTTTATASLSVDRSSSSTTHKSRIERDVGIGLATGGGVALAAGIYFAVQASNAASDVTDAETKGKGNGKDVGALDDRGHSDASKARILAIGGGLGIVGGIVMYMIGRHDEPAPVALGPVTRGHGATVHMGWSF